MLLVVNLITLLVGFAVLFFWSWQLGLVFLVCSIPLWIYGFVFEQKYSVVARRSQDQQGDLATAVEESVHGIRVLKAFGRGKYSLEKFTRQAESCAAPRSRRRRRSPASGCGCCWFPMWRSRSACSAASGWPRPAS